MIKRRKPSFHPSRAEEIGGIAILLASRPDITGRIGDEVTLVDGPFNTESSEPDWLVSKDGHATTQVSSSDLLMQVFGYDGAKSLRCTPWPITLADRHKSAVALINIPRALCRVGDIVMVLEAADEPNCFWVEHIESKSLVVIHENSMCLVECLPVNVAN